MDELPRNFRDPSSEEALAWVRRERVFFAVAVKEWEGHEAEYVFGDLGLHHFLEQVQTCLKRREATTIQTAIFM